MRAAGGVAKDLVKQGVGALRNKRCPCAPILATDKMLQQLDKVLWCPAFLRTACTMHIVWPSRCPISGGTTFAIMVAVTVG